MKMVIIGASAAGISAAKTIRTNDPSAEIIVISKEDRIHSRCMLHKYLGHERTIEDINFISDHFFNDMNIKWLNNTMVESLDTGKKLIFTDHNEEISYDKLLLATGANYFIPPIPGLRESPHVFGFRDLIDAQLIDEACKTAKNAVIIGAGLVGLDAAAALLERKLNVTIIEMMSDILALQLDQKSAMAYQNLFEKAGAKFLLSEKVVSVEDHVAEKDSLIHLASGNIIPADIIIVAAGVRPSYSYLSGTSVNIHNAVLVDENLQTNLKDIYAAGDVTGISGIWPNAMKQGKIAALNMLGKHLIYDDRYALKNTINFYGLATLSIGNINPEPEEDCEILLREDKACYKKIVMKKGTVVGIILQGDIGGSGFWQYLIKNKVDLSNVQKDLFELNYSDFYLVDPDTNEYQYAI